MIFVLELLDDEIKDLKNMNIKTIYDLLENFSIVDMDWEEFNDKDDFEKKLIEDQRDPHFVIIDTVKETFYFEDISVGVIRKEIPYKQTNSVVKKNLGGKKVK